MDIFFEILSTVSLIISVIGIFIIIWGVVLVVIQFLHSEYAILQKHKVQKKNMNYLRLNLSLYIMFGLEFLVAGDIIMTVLNPDPKDLITLGFMITIRTIISYFVNKELKECAEESDG